MITIIKGKITSVFPDNINTDDIIPAWTLQESCHRKFFKQHAFSNYDKNFIKRCEKEKFNIIAAGENFGCGSSREQAIYALVENNIVAIIAKSFPDIFYRNALNNGLLLIKVEEIKHFNKDAKIIIDLKKRLIIIDDAKKISFQIENDEIETFALGGKIGKIKKHLNEIAAKKSILRISRAKLTHPQTIVEKIISNHVGRTVFTGEKIDKLPVDILYFNEVIGPPAIKNFIENFTDFFKKTNKKIVVSNPKRIFFIPDHTVPSSSTAVSEGITFMEKFAHKQGIKCYKEGDGIEHIVLIEDGYIVPGEIICGTDSHTVTNGALNNLSFGIGTTDASFALATGHLYDFEVPKTIRINLTGRLQKGVYAKDLILYLIGRLCVDGATRRAVEFGGAALSNLSMDARTTIANIVVEMGGRTAIFEYDTMLEKYLRGRAKFSYKPYFPDKNCSYEKTVDLHLPDLEPCVAFPHKPSNITSVTKLKEYMKESQKSISSDFAKVTTLKITDAFLGACTNGRYEDFVEAAKILRGRKIHPQVNFIAIPASRNVYSQLMKKGVLQIFADAGTNIESPNCGPCFGKHMGVLGKGAQIISSSNRNYIGRMGSPEAKIFLASPATVAASAVAGKITDPRKFL